MELKLRPYQLEMIDSLWDAICLKNNALGVLSTGLGKTESMIGFCKKAIEFKSDIRIIFVVHKVNLVQQTADRFLRFFSNEVVGTYCASLGKKNINKQITIASVQSIHKSDIDEVNLLIIDEAHRCNNDVDSNYKKFISLLKTKNEKLKIIGITASPFRSNGYIYGSGQIFDKIDFNRDLNFGIENGFLVKPLLKKTDHQFEIKGLKITAGDYNNSQLAILVGDEKKVKSQIDDAMTRLEGRKKVVWFCANIDHAEMVSRLIPEKSSIIHSKQKNDIQQNNMNSFDNGDIRHLVFVNILTEGIDIPKIDSIVLFRPTRSAVSYVQSIGRTLRPYKDKIDSLVLDYGRVIETLGPIDDPQIGMSTRGKAVSLKMKFCPSCLEYLPIAVKNCTICNHEFYTKPKDSIKNLTDKAVVDFDILKRKPIDQVIEIEKVELSKHMSKSGNECLVVTYTTKDFSNRYIKEYFIFNNDWSYKKITKRLIDFDCDFKSSLDDQVKAPIKRTPYSITYCIEDRYPKIKSMVFI